MYVCVALLMELGLLASRAQNIVVLRHLHSNHGYQYYNWLTRIKADVHIGGFGSHLCCARSRTSYNTVVVVCVCVGGGGGGEMVGVLLCGGYMKGVYDTCSGSGNSGNTLWLSYTQ